MNAHILFKDGETRDAPVGLVNKLSPGTYANLHFENTQGMVFLKWQNNLVPDQINRIVVSANGAWQKELAAGANEVEVTPGLREGANTVGFAVVDRYQDEIVKETLAYSYTPGAATGSGRVWGEESEGCACGAASHGSRGDPLLFAGLLLLLRRKARDRGPRCARRSVRAGRPGARLSAKAPAAQPRP